MKIQSLFVALFTGLSINAVYAGPCLNDMNQMKQQIAQYGSISTPDHRNRFDNVSDAKPEKGSICSAKAYRGGMFVCMINWTKSNWGNTFHCA